MADRNEVVRFLVEAYYKGDAGKAAAAAGFAKHQVTGWLEGRNTPQAGNIGWLIHGAFAPEFRVIFEYQPIDTRKGLSGRLKTMFRNHERSSGLYAFYDSMANLVYLGKSDGNLLWECYQQLQKDITQSAFPSGAKQPNKRRDVVRFLSAYYVRGSDYEDYAKHIESLILRISKPVLNKNIGSLQKIS